VNWQYPRITWIYWQSPTRQFVIGRFEGHGTPPTGAHLLTLKGIAGWYTQDQGITSVVLLAPTGWTILMSGTATVPRMELLASQVLTHQNTLLPVPPPATPPWQLLADRRVCRASGAPPQESTAHRQQYVPHVYAPTWLALTVACAVVWYFALHFSSHI
jgi:hypothetical protein